MNDDSKKIILYAHPACPALAPVLGMLKQSSVDFEYINIHQDVEARQRVREINHGYESVPTLVFPDGSTLTESAPHILQKKLEGMGYQVPLLARIMGNMWQIIIGIGVLLVFLRIAGVF